MTTSTMTSSKRLRDNSQSSLSTGYYAYGPQFTVIQSQKSRVGCKIVVFLPRDATLARYML